MTNNMIKKTLSCSIATLGPIGSLPGSGTVATVLTLPLVYMTANLSLFWQLLLIGIVSVVAYKVIPYGIRYYGTDDSPEVVIDEVAGCLIAFVGIPWKLHTVILCFVLFRFFDISKCCGISKLETVGGWAGVLLDDVAAGIVANSIVYVLILFDVI